MSARKLLVAAALANVFVGTIAFAQQAITSDGIVHVPPFDLPPSALMSKEAVESLKARAGMTNVAPDARTGIERSRDPVEQQIAPQVQRVKEHYAVNISERSIAGVKTRIFTPKHGEANPHRVLINLHGGGFTSCAYGCAIVESTPIAGLGRYKVVSVDYRMAPEHAFPAATEDVVAVYKELLTTYRAENIGIYGCSAGGTLTAQTEAWLLDKKLPNPGAIGIFGSGAVRWSVGDSAYLADAINGSPRAVPSASKESPTSGYFKGIDAYGPLVSPGEHPTVAAKFPPTLLITSTRARDMSPTIYTHSQLLKAGVKSQLIVGEGLPHCYIMQTHLPEAQDAFDVIVNFFNENLGAKRAK